MLNSQLDDIENLCGDGPLGLSMKVKLAEVTRHTLYKYYYSLGWDSVLYKAAKVNK